MGESISSGAERLRDGRGEQRYQGPGDRAAETHPSPRSEDCGVLGCTVVRKHWHCACGNPCEVGERECDECWEEE
jgi:hypothetical protein